MARKVSYFSLILVVLSSLLMPSASSATPITDFDGTYVGKFTVTVTVTVPTNPPRTISNTQTVPMQLAVVNGTITGWGTGFVVNSAGKATITIPIAPYGNLTFTANFSHDAITGLTNVKGIVSGSFTAARAVVSGNFTASGGDPFFFALPSVLPKAQMGKKYPGYSLCQPPTPNGVLCGQSARKTTNPHGGRPPYNFRLEMGSILLPAGIILNSRTGLISGTVKTGQKPGIRRLRICAFDSNNWFKGVCRWTSMTLIR